MRTAARESPADASVADHRRRPGDPAEEGGPEAIEPGAVWRHERELATIDRVPPPGRRIRVAQRRVGKPPHTVDLGTLDAAVGREHVLVARCRVDASAVGGQLLRCRPARASRPASITSAMTRRTVSPRTRHAPPPCGLDRRQPIAPTKDASQDEGEPCPDHALTSSCPCRPARGLAQSRRRRRAQDTAASGSPLTGRARSSSGTPSTAR